MDNQLNTQEESISSDQERNKTTGKTIILAAISIPVSIVAMLIIYWFFRVS
jgi:hypothetical protein